ncbi:MAG: hypothetical protein AAF806_00400 [Bacteroidota bacterium]
MIHRFVISSDIYSSTELKELLESVPSELKFELQPSNDARRSVWEDPTVVAAIVSAAGVTLAALIALFGVIWSVRRKEKKEPQNITVEVKITKEAIERLTQKSTDKKQIADQIIQEDVLRLEDLNSSKLTQDYEKIIEELLLEEVVKVNVLGDE